MKKIDTVFLKAASCFEGFKGDFRGFDWESFPGRGARPQGTRRKKRRFLTAWSVSRRKRRRFLVRAAPFIMALVAERRERNWARR